MCGRFLVTFQEQQALKKFAADVLPTLSPRYNIAPTQPILSIRDNADTGRREGHYLTWGLVPGWAEDPSVATKLINARAETAASKPSFRNAFRYRRCLIPASGFYEWKRTGNEKQPWCFHLPEYTPFAFAGLWEHWQHPDGSEIESTCILTCSAGDLMKPIHDRQPVILREQDYDAWLDPSLSDRKGSASLDRLLQPRELRSMTCHAVSPAVNNARNEGAKLLEPVEAEIISPPEQPDLFSDLFGSREKDAR